MILARLRRWLFGSPSLDMREASQGLAVAWSNGISDGVNAPPAPQLTPEEIERLRHIPPAPVPDWYSRSPLADKARRRRQRRKAARSATCDECSGVGGTHMPWCGT